MHKTVDGGPQATHVFIKWIWRSCHQSGEILVYPTIQSPWKIVNKHFLQ
jgi:hypothetical protein